MAFRFSNRNVVAIILALCAFIAGIVWLRGASFPPRSTHSSLQSAAAEGITAAKHPEPPLNDAESTAGVTINLMDEQRTPLVVRWLLRLVRTDGLRSPVELSGHGAIAELSCISDTEYTLCIHAAEFRPGTVQFMASSGLELTITLSRWPESARRPIRGRVTEHYPDHTLPQHAALSRRHGDLHVTILAPWGASLGSWRCDDAGYFDCPVHQMPGEYTFRVARGRLPFVEEKLTLSADVEPNWAGFPLHLDAPAVVVVRATSLEGDVSDAVVNIYAWGGASGRSSKDGTVVNHPALSSRTDENGTAVLSPDARMLGRYGIRAGLANIASLPASIVAELEIAAVGCATAHSLVTINSRGVTTLFIELSPARTTVELQVLSRQGNEMRYFREALSIEVFGASPETLSHSHRVRTDTDGRLSFRLEPGHYRFRARAAGHLNHEQIITIPKGAARYPVHLTLSPASAIVAVIDSAAVGTAIHNCPIHLVCCPASYDPERAMLGNVGSVVSVLSDVGPGSDLSLTASALEEGEYYVTLLSHRLLFDPPYQRVTVRRTERLTARFMARELVDIEGSQREVGDSERGSPLLIPFAAPMQLAWAIARHTDDPDPEPNSIASTGALLSVRLARLRVGSHRSSHHGILTAIDSDGCVSYRSAETGTALSPNLEQTAEVLVELKFSTAREPGSQMFVRLAPISAQDGTVNILYGPRWRVTESVVRTGPVPLGSYALLVLSYSKSDSSLNSPPRLLARHDMVVRDFLETSVTVE